MGHLKKLRHRNNPAKIKKRPYRPPQDDEFGGGSGGEKKRKHRDRYRKLRNEEWIQDERF